MYWCPSMPFQTPIWYDRAKKGMPFQTLLNIVVFGRACPSMLYHIILGFGRAWKGIKIYWRAIEDERACPSRHCNMFLKVFGRAWPSFSPTISFWGSKGHGRASSCGVQKVILILWKGLVPLWEGIFVEDSKNYILGGQFGICYQCILKWIWWIGDIIN